MVFLMPSTSNKLTGVLFTAFRDFLGGAFLFQFEYQLDFNSMHCHWYQNLLFNFLLHCSCSTYLIFLEYQRFMGLRCPTWLVLVKVIHCCLEHLSSSSLLTIFQFSLLLIQWQNLWLINIPLFAHVWYLFDIRCRIWQLLINWELIQCLF